MDTKRFHNPEYKKQIKAVRTYRRQVQPKPETSVGKFFYALGLDSTISKVLTFLVLAGLVYLVYFAKFLQLNTYELSGVSEPARQTVLDDINTYTKSYKYFMPQNNIIFFSKAGFTQYLLKNNYNIAKVNSIQKKVWHSLIISLDQRVPAFSLQIMDKKYILNSDGTVGQEIVQPQSPELLDSTQSEDSTKVEDSSTVVAAEVPVYPVIIDIANENVSSGEYFFAEKQNNFLHYVKDNIPKILGVAITKYELPGKASDQLVVYTDKGFKILFTNTTNPEEYLQRLKTLWTQFTPDQQNKLSYLDLRFAKNAYACFNGDPCTQ